MDETIKFDQVGCNVDDQKYWGVDCHFRSCLKLFICEILDSLYNQPFKDVFAYKSHPFCKVDIMGVVVGVDERSKCHTYAVDDGTGVITCVVWNNLQNNNYGLQTLPGLLTKKLDEISEPVVYELGDFIQVCGKLKVFRNTREVVSTYHKKITDTHEELYRMKELLLLHQKFYDKPFILPKTLHKQLHQLKCAR